MQQSSHAAALRHPIRTLIVCWAAWKALLLLVALSTPGRGYDSSTSLVLAHALAHQPLHQPGPLPAALHAIATKLTRWDAIYFTQAAARGYRFEQEWAFGWGFTRLIALLTAIAQSAGFPHYDGLESVVGILIAHTAHLLSALTLFSLTRTIFPVSPQPAFALTAALLHILSPAGLFLSAPFAESSCALLSFVGCLLFAKGRTSSDTPSIGQDLLVVAAGVVFGTAATLRSNAIFNGLLLLEDALRALYALRYGLSLTRVRRLGAAGLGGLCVGVGFLLPQYIAYVEYCAPSDIPSREWCNRTLPSIYTFVQDHYWHVGLFRYWTLSNVPLFLLAAPMLATMVVSCMWALRSNTSHDPKPTKTKNSSTSQGTSPDSVNILHNLAVSQLLLALLTFTTAHVQIITRISSACPVWVWFLAMPSGKGSSSSLVKNAVTVMALYGIIQGALFSSFLPPA